MPNPIDRSVFIAAAAGAPDGDRALRAWTMKFEGVAVREIRVPEEEEIRAARLSKWGRSDL